MSDYLFLIGSKMSYLLPILLISLSYIFLILLGMFRFIFQAVRLSSIVQLAHEASVDVKFELPL